VTTRRHPITEKGVKGLEQKYDYEIKFATPGWASSSRGSSGRGSRRSTAVLIYGDHAEGFREHQRIYFHGQTLYQRLLHVRSSSACRAAARAWVTERVALLDMSHRAGPDGSTDPRTRSGALAAPRRFHGGKGSRTGASGRC